MVEKQKTIVFVGGSIISLMMALYYKEKKQSKHRIIVLEKANEMGGLYRSLRYADDIVFDYEVHIYTETNKPEIDNLFIDILGENEWEYMCGGLRDVSGTYYNDKLQVHTPFVDLRALDDATKAKYLGDLFLQLKNSVDPKDYRNVKDFLLAKFGKALYEGVFKDIVMKHYHTDPANLDPMATHVIPVGRVVIFDEAEVEGLMNATAIRPRIAFPDQFSLPPCYLRPGRLIYPKKFGMYRVIDTLMDKLKAYGVEFYTNASVEDIKLNGRDCQELSFMHEGQKHCIDNIENLYWNGGYPVLTKQLGLPMANHKPEFIKSAFVNILLDKPPEVSNLYYSYCFKPGMHTFRVVNYFNYCPASVTKNGYPLCVSLWLHDYQGDPCKLALEELKAMKIITDEHKVNFIRAESTDRGFPNLTVDAISHIDGLRMQLRNENYSNIKVIGMLAEKGHFYLTEALEHAFAQIE